MVNPPPPEQEAPALHRLSDKEADRFIRQCLAALKSHSSDFQSGHDKENALAAFEGFMAVLLEVRDIYPASEPILTQFWYASATLSRRISALPSGDPILDFVMPNRPALL